MNDTKKISSAVIRRMPHYLRALEDLHNKGIERISSGELSDKIGYTASQIRQDLNHFGGFGQQGYGYNVDSLRAEIRNILGLTTEYKVVVVGCGRLGHAVANFTNSFESNFIISAIFDESPEIIGEEILGVKVQDVKNMPAYLSAHKMDIGVITVPKEPAQKVADMLIDGGVRGIWNFAPIDLNIPQNVAINNVHLFDGLQSLAYYMNHSK